MALLLETVLLLIRTNVLPELPVERRLTRPIRKRDAAQRSAALRDRQSKTAGEEQQDESPDSVKKTSMPVRARSKGRTDPLPLEDATASSQDSKKTR